MKINSNIIKILFLVSFTGDKLHAIWLLDSCQASGCEGCSNIKQAIEDAADKIDEEHGDLEDDIKDEYIKKILKPNIHKIHIIQNGITRSVARIRAMEHEANIDSKHLIFSLRKKKELSTLPVAGVHE